MTVASSINRAQQLLGTTAGDEYFLVKLLPHPGGCCCCDCWPDTWRTVNQAIGPAQPVPHEGDSLLDLGGIPVVLESHESGPELVLLMAQWAKSISVLLKPISQIVTTFIKALGRERPKGLGKLRVESYRLTDGAETRLATLDLEFPLDETTVECLNSSIQDLLKEGTTEPEN
jgi:hypothetical protein